VNQKNVEQWNGCHFMFSVNFKKELKILHLLMLLPLSNQASVLKIATKKWSMKFKLLKDFATHKR
jgi:hypothetical protein